MSELKQQQIAEKLLSGNFTKTGPIANQLTDPLRDTPMVITLDQLKPYDSNPRIRRNPLYDAIKQSIRERGLDSPPSITRRPGEALFMIRNGGNTRLAILNELWSETKEEHFFKIHCLFKPWVDELTVLTGHLAESELHGKLSFIEQALGVEKAKALYEKDGMLISQRDLANKLTANGYPISQSSIRLMQKTVRWLLPIIPSALYAGLKRADINHIIRLRKSAFATYEKCSVDDHSNFDALFLEVLYRFEGSAELNLRQLQDELTADIATKLNKSYDFIALALSENNTQQTMLEGPPTPELEINEAELFKKKEQDAQELEMNEQEILAIPLPKVKTEPTVKITRTSHIEGAAVSEPLSENEHSNDFINEHIISPIETTARLDEINAIITDLTEQQELDADFKRKVIESIPVQVGGLYPISDIWYISTEINHSEALRTHISQLVLEVADEVDIASYIKTTPAGLGFTVSMPQAITDKNQQALLSMFRSLTDTTACEHLVTLLTGLPVTLDIERLSDAAFVKLMRILRLMRRLYELMDKPDKNN